MTQTIIYKKTKSHWDDESEWNPSSSGQGTDTHIFTIPNGNRFARYLVDVEVASAGSGCLVETGPDVGAKGEQWIKVRWWYNPFGKIRYTLSVFTGDPEVVHVQYGESSWAGKAMSALKQGLDLDLSGRGAVAMKLFSRILRMSGKPMSRNFYTEPELSKTSATRDVALALIASIRYGVMGGLILLALDNGYIVTAKFDPHGMLPFDDELTIEMRKS